MNRVNETRINKYGQEAFLEGKYFGGVSHSLPGRPQKGLLFTVRSTVISKIQLVVYYQRCVLNG